MNLYKFRNQQDKMMIELQNAVIELWLKEEWRTQRQFFLIYRRHFHAIPSKYRKSVDYNHYLTQACLHANARNKNFNG